MLHIIGAFGEFEASLIRERVRAGLANAKAHGKRLGRPPTIDAVHVRKLRAAGLSLGIIAKQLNVSKTAVHKTLLKQRV
jgi:DNA invertase Pin-like site-specific DNA recombinase